MKNALIIILTLAAMFTPIVLTNMSNGECLERDNNIGQTCILWEGDLPKERTS